MTKFMAKITYTDKVALNVNSEVADINKCNASDLNEIKTVVNTNDTNALYKSNIKTSTTTSDSDAYSCTYINSNKLDKSSVKTSKTTSDSDVYSCTYVNDKTTHIVVTGTLDTEITIGEGIIPLNILSGTLRGFSLSDNGGIEIQGNFSKVLVSGSVFAANIPSYTYLWVDIRKNNTPVSKSISTGYANFTSTVFAPKIIDVSQGDIITLYKLDSSSYNIRSDINTWLTIEVIE